MERPFHGGDIVLIRDRSELIGILLSEELAEVLVNELIGVRFTVRQCIQQRPVQYAGFVSPEAKKEWHVILVPSFTIFDGTKRPAPASWFRMEGG